MEKKKILHILLTYIVSDEKSAVILCLSMKYLFSLAAFKIFSLLLLSNLIMICLEKVMISRNIEN